MTTGPHLLNALYQWQDGARRLMAAEPDDRAHLERAMHGVLDELRRRLGSSFELRELADLYATGTDWAEDVATRRSAGLDTVLVVDAAFARYSREASDFAGGRMYFRDG
ncbi:MAG: hypothetical protein ACR2HC_02355 [Thermoleophilaceae bacterium]